MCFYEVVANVSSSNNPLLNKHTSQIYPIYSILSPEGYLCTKILSLNQGQQNAQK
jgi:hypothetical protein